MLPRPRLLGGGPKDGKMSKLAALAAKRRQQEASKSSSGKSDQVGSTDDYAETLNKLRISQGRETSKSEQSSTPPDEQVSETLSNGQVVENASLVGPPTDDQHQNELYAQHLRAGPSAFASLLAARQDSFEPNISVPLPQADSALKAFEFSEPSPDDKIHQAQTGKPSR